MSPLCFLAALLITTSFHITSSTLSSPSHKPNSGTPAPAPAPAPPHPQLAPDVSPLLPSSGGGSAHPPVGSFMPIIPSSRSPPNPDSLGSAGLDANFGPSSLVHDSSAVPGTLVKEGFDLCCWILGFFGLYCWLSLPE